MMHTSIVEDDGDNNIVKNLRSLNRTLAFCSDSVRYDIQRNLILAVEELSRTRPLTLALLKSVHEVADTFADGYEGRGKVHVGLRRIADNEVIPKGGNVKSLASLSRVFMENNANTDRYLVDRMLVSRGDSGELSLTGWGTYVLGYLDRQSAKEADLSRKPDGAGPQECLLEQA